jgi:hypothetical protein
MPKTNHASFLWAVLRTAHDKKTREVFMPLTMEVLRNVRKAELRKNIQDLEAEKTRLWHRYCQLKAEAEGLRTDYKELEVEEAAERLAAKQKAEAQKNLEKFEKKENITVTKEVLDQVLKELL